jgi:hypothetical protein
MTTLSPPVLAYRRLRAWLRGAACAAAIATGAGSALACGLEDPSSIAARRGALNLAYPESLHVGTAVWQAQLAGRLPRDPVAQRDDLSPEARGAMRLIRANALLRQFAAQLPVPGTSTAQPNLALVLLGPVMWNRIEAERGAVKFLPHVAGPERGDVVVVTDLAVVEAVALGSLTFGDALALGVMRLYGPAADVALARGWLTDRPRG